MRRIRRKNQLLAYPSMVLFLRVRVFKILTRDIGVFLKAFVGINENPTFIEDQADHVNVDKLRMVAVQSKEIIRLQQTPYNLIPVKEILLCVLTF